MRPELRCACVPHWRFCGSYDFDREAFARWLVVVIGALLAARWCCSSPPARTRHARRTARRRSGGRPTSTSAASSARRTSPSPDVTSRSRAGFEAETVDRRRGPVAPVRAREGRLHRHPRRDDPARGHRRSSTRARHPNVKEVDVRRSDRHEDRQLLHRRGRARHAASSTSSIQRLVNGLNFGLMLALAAVGLSLVFGTTGISNFAHAEMVTFGAVVALLVFGRHSRPAAVDRHPGRVILSAVLGSARRHPLETPATKRARASCS